ncbi:hypothetical protein J4Q44_G00319080 [Coregonus suidteri]|uniref:Uncharacterized protein n=1 Tax=Coregonus suidteri TaxID=861788 RepID=A0AAN8L445_9TELE
MGPQYLFKHLEKERGRYGFHEMCQMGATFKVILLAGGHWRLDTPLPCGDSVAVSRVLKVARGAAAETKMLKLWLRCCHH